MLLHVVQNIREWHPKEVSLADAVGVFESQVVSMRVKQVLHQIAQKWFLSVSDELYRLSQLETVVAE